MPKKHNFYLIRSDKEYNTLEELKQADDLKATAFILGDGAMYCEHTGEFLLETEEYMRDMVKELLIHTLIKLVKNAETK